MSSYQYRKSHCGDKTVVRSSYLHNGISYTGKTTSLYWIRAQNTKLHLNWYSYLEMSLDFQADWVSSLPASVRPSVCPYLSKLYVVRMITRHKFEIESPNLNQTCISGYTRLVLKKGVIDIDLHGHMAISTQNSRKWHSTLLLYTDLGRSRGVIRPNVFLFHCINNCHYRGYSCLFSLLLYECCYINVPPQIAKIIGSMSIRYRSDTSASDRYPLPHGLCLPWWRHQIETFSALLALCAWNSPVTGEFPSQRPVMRSVDVSSDLRLHKR